MDRSKSSRTVWGTPGLTFNRGSDFITSNLSGAALRSRQVFTGGTAAGRAGRRFRDQDLGGGGFGRVSLALLALIVISRDAAGGENGDPIVSIGAFAIREPNVDTGVPEFSATATIWNDEVPWNKTFADVSLNGESLAGDYGQKDDTGLTVPEPGDEVTLRVDYQGRTFAETLTLPDTVANINAPADGGTVSASADVIVLWDATAGANAPNYVRVGGRRRRPGGRRSLPADNSASSVPSP